MAGEFHPICIALAGFTASGDFHSALRTKKEIAGMIVPYHACGVKPDAGFMPCPAEARKNCCTSASHSKARLIKVQEPPLLKRAPEVVRAAVIDT